MLSLIVHRSARRFTLPSQYSDVDSAVSMVSEAANENCIFLSSSTVYFSIIFMWPSYFLIYEITLFFSLPTINFDKVIKRAYFRSAIIAILRSI